MKKASATDREPGDKSQAIKGIALLALALLGALSVLNGIFEPFKSRQGSSSGSRSPAANMPLRVKGPPSGERAVKDILHRNIVDDRLVMRNSARTSFADWGRSPFTSPSEKTGDAGRALSLEGIAWDPKSPKAVINDVIYEVGEEVIPGLKVKSIEKNKVVLSGEGGEVTLLLGVER